MFLLRTIRLLPLFLAASFANNTFAAPHDNPLLKMVPPGSEIVAGIEDTRVDHLLLVTKNNTIDFYDFLALAGVDTHKKVYKLIEVAASSPEGELKERLILASGQFDHDTIFHAATFNGAAINDYNGVSVLVIAPFEREREMMNDVRWMAILDNKVLAFGTPVMVKTAIDRYRTGQQPDKPLEERLAQLPKDEGSWNVLVMTGSMLARHVAPADSNVLWAHLLDRADALTMGIHNGSHDRVDLNLETASERDASQAAASLRPQGVKTVSWPEQYGMRMENISVERTHVQATFAVSQKDFSKWLGTTAVPSLEAHSGGGPLIP